MTLDEIKEFIVSRYGEAVIEATSAVTSPASIILKSDHLLKVCSELHRSETTYFDMLSCITGIDNGADAGTMELAYNLYSIPYDFQLIIYIKLDRDNPIADSVAEIWKTADWHEREAYDLFGIHFRNHSDLRRILLPADWEGHPLRKDYQQQEYYRGIKVEY